MNESDYSDWKPTPENINALPEPIRRYIHDLITKHDPSGDLRTIADLTEQRDALLRLVEELQGKNQIS
jgi:hypothetical protein